MLETYIISHLESEAKTEYKYLIPGPEDVDIANWAAKEITDSKTMIPKTTEELLNLFQEGRSVVILDYQNKPIAHAAITFLYSNSVIEIGGVIVDPKERRKGLRSAVVRGAIALGKDNFPGCIQMALCNQYSLDLFLKLGAQELDLQTALKVIPQEAWELCSSCPNQVQAKSQGKLCCDTPVSLESVNPYKT